MLQGELFYFCFISFSGKILSSIALCCFGHSAVNWNNSFQLEGTLKGHPVQTPCNDEGHLQLLLLHLKNKAWFALLTAFANWVLLKVGAEWKVLSNLMDVPCNSSELLFQFCAVLLLKELLPRLAQGNLCGNTKLGTNLKYTGSRYSVHVWRYQKNPVWTVVGFLFLVQKLTGFNANPIGVKIALVPSGIWRSQWCSPAGVCCILCTALCSLWGSQGET